MPILLGRGGKWVVVDNVYTYGTPTGQRRRVIGAWLYQTDPTKPPPPITHDDKGNVTSPKTTVKRTLFDFSTPPPAVVGLVGVSPPSTDPNHHVRATLSWTAAPKAVSYKIHRWEPATTTGTTTAERNPADFVPSPVTATSYVFTGLLPERTYSFRVTYFNEFGVESLPSKTITLKTGSAQVTAKSLSYPSNPPADKYNVVNASSSDTWTKAKQWGNAYQVTQGYLSSTNDRGYGCVNYYGGYTYTAGQLDTMYASYGAGIGKAILDHLGSGTTVVDARFSRVHQIAGCAAGENVVIYPATFSYSSGATAPKAVGTSTYFDAPGPGHDKNNFRLVNNSLLILWATNLIKKVQVHNGLMIYRSDTVNTPGDGYAGYCKCRSKSDPADTKYDWRIDVWLKFSFVFKSYVAPVWS